MIFWDDIFLPHQWLSTGKQIDVCTEFNSLIDDIVHLFIGQVHVVSILCRPAAGAFQIACTGGIQEDGPGDIAVIFLFISLLPLIPQQTTVMIRFSNIRFLTPGSMSVHRLITS